MIKILVITHDLSLSGAPKSLLYTFEHLFNSEKDRLSFDVVSLAKDAGLGAEFLKIGANLSYANSTQKQTRLNKIKTLITGSEGSNTGNSFSLQDASKYDVVYANTVVALKLGVQIKKNNSNTKLILHVHELKTVIKEFAPNLLDFDSFIDAYVVPSQMNKDCLINDFLISKDKITIIRESSKLCFSQQMEKDLEKKVFNVMMCGGAYWRKGDDVFIQVANLVVKQNPNIHFYWVGFQSDERKRVNELDICNLKLEKNVFFTGETTSPNDWLSKMDLFFLSSREDPFPLAAIEAGMFGLPICCFANATGLTEVLIDKSYIAPYLDLNKMAEIILNAYNNPVEKRVQMEQKEVFEKFNPANIANETKELIFSILK